MRIRKVRASRLRDHLVTLAGASNDPAYDVHCTMVQDGLISVFAGSWCRGHPKDMIEVVDYGGIDEDQIMRLQMILSYGHKVSKVAYRCHLLRYLARNPELRWAQLAQSMCCTPQWLWYLLDVPAEIGEDQSIIASNAHNLAKLLDWKGWTSNARSLPASEFATTAIFALKDQREARRKKT